MSDDETISRPLPGHPGIRGFTGRLERAAFAYAQKRQVTADDVQGMARAIQDDAAALMRDLDAAIARARQSAA